MINVCIKNSCLPSSRENSLHRQSQYLLTCGCLAARSSRCVKVVTESRPSRDIDNVLQITIKFTLEANNRTRVNTSYILGHGIEKAYCSLAI